MGPSRPVARHPAAGRSSRSRCPAVVAVREGINLPRYPSVPGRLRAKKKEIERLSPERAAGGPRDDPAGAPRRADADRRDPRDRPGRGRAGRRGHPRDGPAVTAILAFVEHADGHPDRLSLEMLTLARGLGAATGLPVHAALSGEGAEAAARELGGHGVATAHLITHPRLDDYAPEALAASVGAAGVDPGAGGRGRPRQRTRDRGPRPSRCADRPADGRQRRRGHSPATGGASPASAGPAASSRRPGSMARRTC